MGGQKLQSLWGSATNFVLAGALFGASISLLSLFCYCCRKTQRESLNSCRALFGGSIVLLFLFCYCCHRKSKTPPTMAPRSESAVSNATVSTTAQQSEISMLEAVTWDFPRSPSPPPPYEEMTIKKFYDSPPPYDTVVANMQSSGYV